MNKNDQKFIVEKIRSEYITKKDTQLDALRALDAKVKRPVNILAYTLGTISALILGMGMSLTMTDIGVTLHINDSMTYGIIIGIIGIFLCIFNFMIYKRFLNYRRKKYSTDIINLSEEIIEKCE